MPYPAEIQDLCEKVKNWGRWGDDDELGTLNLITDEVVMEAMSSVKSGRRFSLAYPFQEKGLQIGSMPGRINPVRTMVQLDTPVLGDPTLFCTSDDVVTMGLQASTHWDGLCHASIDGLIYGGRPSSSIGIGGASICGIEKVTSLTGRGVLMDIAGLYGVDVLEPGHAITAEDLRNAEEKQGVTVRPGDILAIRTGMMSIPKGGDVMGYYGTAIEGMPMPGVPGVGLSAAEYFFERDVAAVATDNVTFEVLPWDPAGPEWAILPLHVVDIVYMGLTQGQNWDLEALAADCAADGQYDFLLEASPLPFVGGLGSPVNPVAIK